MVVEHTACSVSASWISSPFSSSSPSNIVAESLSLSVSRVEYQVLPLLFHSTAFFPNSFRRCNLISLHINIFQYYAYGFTREIILYSASYHKRPEYPRLNLQLPQAFLFISLSTTITQWLQPENSHLFVDNKLSPKETPTRPLYPHPQLPPSSLLLPIPLSTPRPRIRNLDTMRYSQLPLSLISNAHKIPLQCTNSTDLFP